MEYKQATCQQQTKTCARIGASYVTVVKMTASPTRIELYYDVVSPYSWFAFEVIIVLAVSLIFSSYILGNLLGIMSVSQPLEHGSEPSSIPHW
jgi:hypothetical protein